MTPTNRVQALLYAFAHAHFREAHEANTEDLEGLAGVTHFGYPAGWVYGDGIEWPAYEVRPCLGPFGVDVEAA